MPTFGHDLDIDERMNCAPYDERKLLRELSSMCLKAGATSGSLVRGGFFVAQSRSARLGARAYWMVTERRYHECVFWPSALFCTPLA